MPRIEPVPGDWYSWHMTRDGLIARLRAEEAALRRVGVAGLSLFGSAARGEDGAGSDIDVLVRFEPAGAVSLLDVVHVEHMLSDAVGRTVQITPEPVRRPRLAARIESERVRVF